ncbi:RHS repeat-associated core domain-containing protein [Lentzea sp. NPDC059081]|uniref:RHS repeat-associated core domain-containing protein n=1 Tax=Lentzea sp. NPDC059081 TaxID=3346719 RepID=UPI0036C5A2C7
MLFPRSRKGRIAAVVGLIMVLLVGTVGPSAMQLVPQWAAGGALDPSELAPDQSWGTAADQPHETEGTGAANRAMPRSELAKYPQPNFPAAPEPPPNSAREVAAPVGFTGYDAATSKEDESKRDANSRTFHNTDGTETTEFSQARTNYRKPDGSWAPIDTKLVRDGNGWRNGADSVDSRFGGTASESPFVSMKIGGGEFAFGFAGTSSAQAKVSDSTVVYPGVVPHTDLRLDVLPGGVKETLVLAGPDAATAWVFPLRLNGLRAKVVANAVELTDASGAVEAIIPAGHMTDAAGALSGDITYELVTHNGGQALKMTADASWVRDGARRFPIAVDPTVTGPAADPAISTNGSSVLNGTTLKSGDGYTTYLKFGLSGIANHRVFGAQLYLSNYDAPSCRPQPISVHAVNQSWDSGTKSVLPTGGALGGGSFAYGYVGLGQSHSACPPRPEAIDLGEGGRALVEGWVKGGQANNGFAVKALAGWKLFAGAGTANPPRLFVTSTPYDAGYRVERGIPEPPVHRTSDNPADPNAPKPTVKIAVTNKSGQTWSQAAGYKLSYRAFSSTGQPKDARVAAELPRSVPPGDTIVLDARVFQLEPGDYLLDFSMVHGNTFFTDEQIPPARLSLTVFELPPIVKAQYPPAGHSSPVLTPQLWADAVDVDAPPNTTIDYEFEVCQRNDVTGETNVGCRLSPRSKSRTWTVPKGWLQWSETYYWRAFAIDPSGARSEALQFSALLTAVPQPDVTSHLGGAPYSAGDLDFDPQIGNYTTAAVDSAIGVTGPELTVARTYNSLDPRKDLAFGAGWSTRYDMRVVPDDDGTGNVVVTYPDGQAVRFGKNAEDGSFDPPPGRFATFYQDSSTRNYVLVDKSNATYTFRSSDGKVASIFDNAGRLVEFDYGVSGQLKRAINRTSNRTLYFTWSGNHVKEVRTDPPVSGGTPIRWTYEYFGDQLKKVCDPTTACTQYEYSTGSHYRSAVMDSKPDSYWRLGEPAGNAAVSQVATNLTKDWGEHRDTTRDLTGPLDGSPDRATGFNGSSSLVKLPDGAIKKSRDLSIELWFRTTTGGPLVGFQHKPFDENPEGAVPVLYVDRDGKLRGQFWHGRVSPITSSAAVNNDQWHHVVLTGSLATTTMFLDGTKVGEITGAEIDDSRLNFGQIGAAHAVGPADWAPYGWWPGEGKKFFGGQIDEVALYQHPLGEAAVKQHYAAREHSDQLTKVTMPSGRVAAELSYDTVNDRISQYTDENGGLWKLGLPQVSGTEDKDAAGRSVKNLVRSIEVTDPGKRSHFFDYDPVKGRIIRFVAPLGVGVRTEDRPDPSVVPTTPTGAPPCTGTPTPNPDGSPTYCGGKTGNDPTWVGGPVQGVGVRTYDYDESGFQHVITDENGHQVELKHDERGNVLSRKTCRTSSQCDTEHFTYQPPAAGHVNDTDPRIDKQLTARDARSASATDNTYLTSSQYNERGDLTKQTMPDGTTVVHDYTKQGDTGVDGANVPVGLLKSTTDGRGKTTKYVYYGNGDLFSVTEPPRADNANGITTEYRYDLLGRKVSEKQVSDEHPAGLETKFLLDGRNKPVEVTDAAVTNAVTNVKHTRHTRTTFNADGQPERVDIADLTGGDETRTLAYGYDDRGRQSSVTDAEGATTSYAYDVFGNRTSVVDPLGTKVEYAYTARNKLAEVRLRGFHGKPISGGIGTGETADDGQLLVMEAYTYDLGGRLIWQTDAMGRKTVYDYYQNGLLFRSRAEVRGAGGTKTLKLLEENTYDAAGNVLTRKGAGDRLTSFKYNRNNQVEEVVADPGSGKLARTTLYTYDPNGLVKQVVKSGQASNTGTMSAATSEVVDYTYDSVGNQLTEAVKLGSQALTTSRTYDRRGLMTSETDPRGFTTEFSYDEQERQVRVKQPAVAVETGGGAPVTARPENVVGYNTFGDEVESKDENGQVTKRFYDKNGRPLRVELPDYVAPGTTTPVKAVTSTRYDPAGNAVETTNPRGAVTRFRYDQLGRMVERQDPKADAPTEVGGVWKYTYTHKGEQLSATDPTGARTESTYDDLGRVATQSVLERKPVAAAFTTTFEYNDAGELVKATAPNNDVTKFGYDALGQRITATDPANVTTKFGYDGAGRQVWQQDALGRTSFVRHDAAGRMDAQFSLDGAGQILRRTGYTHDAAGNVETATDGMGKTARYSYDALGRLTQQVEPVSDTESITTSFGYDAKGNRTRYTDGRATKFVTTYNAWSLPESVVEPSTEAHPNAADRTWTTTYDSTGNVEKMVAPGGITRERQYDFLNRLTKETGAGSSVAAAERVQAYDPVGRLLESSAPGGKNVFTYNDRSGLLTANGPSGDSSFEYDDLGRMKTRADASGTARFTYDKGRLHTATDSITGTGQVFGYNDAGQLSRVQYGSARTRDVDYDALGRMKSDVVKDGTTGSVVSSLAYEYDNNDRLTRKVTSGLAGAGDNTYTYDQSNRLKSWTVGGVTTAYEWDASGNRTRAGAKTAVYDERNRLKSDSDYTYRYSPSGAMLSRTSSGFEEKFSFDAFDRMIAVGQTAYAYDGFDRVVSRNTKKFAYAGTDIDPVSDSDSLFGRGASGELLSLQQGTEKRLALTDKHGDLVGGFDPAQGGMQDSTAYDPFGKQIASSGTKRSVGYQGDWTDPDSGQVNMGARWYQPSSGAFSSRDTVSASSGASVLFNRYTYGAGRPLDMIDPDGHWPNWGAVWNGVKKVASVGLEVVKEVSGYNDIANFIREPSLGNFLWAASNFVPFGKLAKGAKYLVKYGDDLIGGARKYGDDIIGAGRKYGDDVVGAGRKYGDDIAGAVRRNAGDMAKTAAKEAAQAAARKAAAAAAAAAARLAAMKAVTARAKSAIAHAVKNNAMPVLQAALKPKIAMKDLVSSSANMPARLVGAVAENVQDVNKVWDTIKATVIKPGVSVVQSVGEQMVSDFANSQVPGLGDLISLFGPNRKRGNDKAKDSGAHGRNEAGASCPISRNKNSFTGDTPVLMADGSRKPIRDLKVGDLVLATDPTTGKTAAKKITDVRGYLTDSAVHQLDVSSESGGGKISVTDEHPFWLPDLGKWLSAGDIEPGYRFLTADNRPATVTGTRTFSGGRLVYNLTVDGLHTYYVGAGGAGKAAVADVLVHNADPFLCERTQSFGEEPHMVAETLSDEVIASNQWTSKTRGSTAEAIRLPGGQVYAYPSVRGGTLPIVVPSNITGIVAGARQSGISSKGNGSCGLIICLSMAVLDGHDPTGSDAAAVMLRNKDNPNYMKPIGPCALCRPVVNHFRIDFHTDDGI